MTSDLFGPFDPYFAPSVEVWHDDCLTRLHAIPDATFDSCVTDPPYHLTTNDRYGKTTLDSLTDSNSARARDPAPNDAMARLSRGFMGKTWDGGDVAFRVETWREVLRVLKPGAHLVAFGGTRTAHRMKCAIEDAGFQVRDAIRYECDGSSKYGPLMDSLTDDQRAAVMELLHEAAGGSELAWTFGSGFPKSHDAGNGWGTGLKPAHEPIILARKPLDGTVAANVMRHGTGAINIDGCRIGTEEIKSSGSTGMEARNAKHGARPIDYQNNHGIPSVHLGRFPANVIHDGADGHPWPMTNNGHWPKNRPGTTTTITTTGHSGQSDLNERSEAPSSAARFFYQAKADKRDRAGSRHPTVKPIDLIAYLQRLVTPPSGLTLDCFAGSGTAVTAAMREGFRIVAIERDVTYFNDIVMRHRRGQHQRE